LVAHNEDAKEDEDDNDRGNPNKNEKSKQGALEETMGRLRLADSMKRSAREYSNQQRSPAFNNSTIVALPLTKPCDAAQVLEEKGVVRLGGVLSESTCDSIAKAICSELDAAITKGRDLIPGRGEGFGNFGTGFGFGASRMKEQRWDMYLPLEGEYRIALDELLTGENAALGELFRKMLLGDDNNDGIDDDHAELFDWSSFTSDPGAARQPVHPDNRFQPEPPLLTAFVALQDITLDMGPTIFLPQTHTALAHDQFNGGEDAKDQLLSTCGYEYATLSKGDAAVFDPRCLHCGGANTSKSRRSLLYVSFRNPRCRDSNVEVPPGSMLAQQGPRRVSLRDFSP
jgi:hypothetical protein